MVAAKGDVEPSKNLLIWNGSSHGSDYENSFSDAIEGAGVDYTVEPVRLARRFHPKLYLFTRGETASLFVASANP